MTTARFANLAACLAGLLCGAPRAWAYSCITTSCSRYCQSPVPYRLGTPSADLGLATTEAELKKGMEAWTQPSCSGLEVQYGGTTTEPPGNGNGVVSWVESGWGSGSGTIGVTTSRLSRGCLTAHINMNGVNFRWTNGTPGRGQVNAFTIIAHEGGHYLGLGHSNASGAVMAARYGGGIIPLNGDDEAGICKIYPGGGGMPVPQAPGTGGAGGSSGGAGGANGMGGSGGGGSQRGLCATCTKGTDCASGTCLRNNNSGERFCGQPCGNGCPSGYRCVAADGTNGVNQCIPSGGSCATSAPPPMGGAGGAGGGGGVSPDGSGQGGAGGGGMSVAECTEDADCAGDQRCVKERCTSDDAEGTILVADGEACEVNEDCQSRLCLELQDGSGFCSRICGATADCVSGFACRTQGDERVCLPVEGPGDEQTPDGEPGAGPDDEGDSVSNQPVKGGCAMAGAAGTSSGAWLLLLGLGAAHVLRRRRKLHLARAGGWLLLSFALASGQVACSSGGDDEDVMPSPSDEDPGQGSGGGGRTPGTPDEAGTGGRAGSGAPMPDADDDDPPPSGGGGRGGNGGSNAGGVAGAGAGGNGSGGSAVNGGAGGKPQPPPPGGAGGSGPPPAAGCSVTLPNASGKEPGGAIPVCCTPGASDKAMIDEAFALLNAHRMANGRSALAYDPKLEQAIQGHCQHMAEHTFFAHDAPEGAVARFTERAKACGASASGENIAYNQRSPAQVMTSWKNSSGHNMNMLSTGYKRVGIGLHAWRWGQIFGR